MAPTLHMMSVSMFGPDESRHGLTAFPPALTELTVRTIDAAPVLREYAHRDGHGLVSGYDKRRWACFFAELPGTVASGEQPTFDDWYTRGDARSRRTEPHTTEPTGDLCAVACPIAAELAVDPV
jgi:alpha-N-acetylglucosaminidase